MAAQHATEDSSITYEQLNDLSAEFDDAETELSTCPLSSHNVLFAMHWPYDLHSAH